MSDNTTVINGVSIEARGGGYFILSHEAINPPIKVRGEEKAKLLAEQLGNQISEGLPLQLIDSDEEGEGEDQMLSATDELAALEARVAELRAAGATVALPNPHGAVDQHNARAAVPGRLRGKLDADKRKALSDVGVKMTRIILDQNDNIPPTGLFIAHNGRTFMIQTSVEVDVPNFIIEVLRHAVQDIAVQDPETRQVIGYRKRLRFPFQVVPVEKDD